MKTEPSRTVTSITAGPKRDVNTSNDVFVSAILDLCQVIMDNEKFTKIHIESEHIPLDESEMPTRIDSTSIGCDGDGNNIMLEDNTIHLIESNRFRSLAINRYGELADSVSGEISPETYYRVINGITQMIQKGSIDLDTAYDIVNLILNNEE